MSSSCLANEAQYNAMGEYTKVCSMDDGTDVFIHNDPLMNMYTYYLGSLQVHNQIMNSSSK